VTDLPAHDPGAFNPHLAPPDDGSDPTKGGAESIERPGGLPNIVWQTRPAPLTAFEDAMAERLMAAFDHGAEDLPALADHLNAEGPAHPDGAAWDADRVAAMLAQLAGPEG